LKHDIYFERQKPQYDHLSASQFLQIKRLAKDDGKTDDTSAFQQAINQVAGTNKVLFVDAGSYIITDTIFVPPGTKIVGECWAQLVASGPKFSDALNPRPLLRVGTPGQTGGVELQDLLFSGRGSTRGLVGIE
jgi:hypothetical protein